MIHGLIEHISPSAYLFAKKVNELSLDITEQNEIHANVLGVLLDRIRDCQGRIKENPEDKNLYIELAKLEGYVDTIHTLHDSTSAVLDELKRFWVALSKGEDFPEWDD